MTMATEGDMTHHELQRTLQKQVCARRASLTPVEEAFLHALLIDPPSMQEAKESSDCVSDEAEKKKQQLQHASKVLSDDMLFSVPACLVDDTREAEPERKSLKRPSVVKNPKDYRFLVGLWQAHEDGVTVQKLKNLSSRKSITLKPDDLRPLDDSDNEESDNEDDESAKSDQEVRGEATADGSSACSWDEKEGGFDHFDAWEVLKDEYAADFGFDYTPDGSLPSMDDSELEQNKFKILGTSADDKSAHPHVLSPPLIDALLYIVPDHLQGQNMWMKYSLVRDGASLDTFKQYARASKDTILAIETTKGDVFGCYTSTPWRTSPSFFGGGPSFVWKMRHGRNTPCHSLIDQAQMESEIDVFFYLGADHKVQCCKSNIMGVGEGNVAKYDIYGKVVEDDEDENETNYGFAIALEDDLLSGTSSKCTTFKNPCLVNSESNGEAFDVLNLELWTFTPCFSLDSAQKLEMTQFFVSESMRNASLMSTSSAASTQSDKFSSGDLSQEQFYRRVGQGDDHEELRERWQYRNMMDGNLNPNRGIGASPRFNNSSA